MSSDNNTPTSGGNTNERLERIEKKLDEHREVEHKNGNAITQLRADMNEGFSGMRAEMKEGFSKSQGATDEGFSKVLREMRGEK